MIRSVLGAVLVLGGMAGTGAPATAAPATPAATAWAVEASAPVTYPIGDLADVSCVAGGFCASVGSYFDRGSHTQPLAEVRRSGTWAITQVNRPAGTTLGDLRSVSCVSASNCVAVGMAQGSGPSRPIAELWNGSSWKLSLPPAGTTTGVVLNGVSCASATFCLAVGHGGSTPLLAVRWNGTAWSNTPIPAPAGAVTPELYGVSCASATACFAVGEYFKDAGGGSFDTFSLIEKWNGTAWSIVNTPATSAVADSGLEAVSCPSATSCAAVGTSGQGQAAFALKLAGAAWSVAPVPAPPAGTIERLHGVSCVSASSCVAVGSQFDPSSSTGERVLAEAWNGAAWSRKGAANRAGTSFDTLEGVDCLSASDCVAAGTSSLPQQPAQTLVEHWNGTAFSITPSADFIQRDDGEFRSVSCPTTARCVAVGRLRHRNTAFAEIRNGTAWTVSKVVGTAAARLNGVSCATATSCVAVGSLSNIGSFTPQAQKFNGTAWSATPLPAVAGSAELAGVSCVSATFCMAVGNVGSRSLVLTWNGSAWTLRTPPASAPGLTSVSCVSATACVAVGGNGFSSQATSLVWNGSALTQKVMVNPPGRNPAPTGVSCVSATNCVAVGSDVVGTAMAEKWNGSGWTLLTTPQPGGGGFAALAGIDCITGTSCVAVGQVIEGSTTSPLAEHFDGSAWTLEAAADPPTELPVLTAVSCPPGGHCVAVGVDGPNLRPLVEVRSA